MTVMYDGCGHVHRYIRISCKKCIISMHMITFWLSIIGQLSLEIE